MRFYEYIGEFFLFRWLFRRLRKNERQEMSEMDVPFSDNNDIDFGRYCDMDEADSFGHDDYDCQDDYDCCEDFIDEQEDYDMIDDDF